MDNFNDCPKCYSENTAKLDFHIRECLECHKQYSPSIERLRYEQNLKPYNKTQKLIDNYIDSREYFYYNDLINHLKKNDVIMRVAPTYTIKKHIKDLEYSRFIEKLPDRFKTNQRFRNLYFKFRQMEKLRNSVHFHHTKSL